MDYITKPLRPAIVLARVHAHLELKHARDALRRHNVALEAEVASRMRENTLIQEVTIRALARLAETRDNETGNHILRTQGYVRSLALRARSKARFAAELGDENIALMAKSAPLHDIGKVGIPDHVLLKPGKLNADEWTIMKTQGLQATRALPQQGGRGARSVAKATPPAGQQWFNRGQGAALSAGACNRTWRLHAERLFAQDPRPARPPECVLHRARPTQ